MNTKEAIDQFLVMQRDQAERLSARVSTHQMGQPQGAAASARSIKVAEDVQKMGNGKDRWGDLNQPRGEPGKSTFTDEEILEREKQHRVIMAKINANAKGKGPEERIKDRWGYLDEPRGQPGKSCFTDDEIVEREKEHAMIMEKAIAGNASLAAMVAEVAEHNKAADGALKKATALEEGMRLLVQKAKAENARLDALIEVSFSRTSHLAKGDG